MPVRCCRRRRSMSRRAVAVTSAGSAGFTSQSESPNSWATVSAASSVASTSPSVGTPCSWAAASSRRAVLSCRPPVRMIASGGGCFPRTAWRTSSSEETIAVSNPACSSAAFTRTACSRSSVVIRTLSAMSVRRVFVRRTSCVVRGVRAAEQIDGVPEERGEDRQSFFHTVGRTWQVDDQRLPSRTGAAAREPGTREPGARSGANGLRDPLGLTLENRGGGFRRHVTLGEAGAAGREHDIDFAGVRPAHELARDAVRLIRHHAAHHHLVAVFRRPIQDRLARPVGALAYCAQIRNRENPDSHFLVLCGTKGILTTSAATFLLRTSISILVPVLARSAGR